MGKTFSVSCELSQPMCKTDFYSTAISRTNSVSQVRKYNHEFCTALDTNCYNPKDKALNDKKLTSAGPQGDSLISVAIHFNAQENFEVTFFVFLSSSSISLFVSAITGKY